MVIVITILGIAVLTMPAVIYRASSNYPMPMFGALAVAIGVMVLGEFALAMVGAQSHGSIAIPAVLSFFILRTKAR